MNVEVVEETEMSAVVSRTYRHYSLRLPWKWAEKLNFVRKFKLFLLRVNSSSVIIAIPEQSSASQDLVQRVAEEVKQQVLQQMLRR